VKACIGHDTLAGTSSLTMLLPEQEPESVSLSPQHSMDDNGRPVANVVILTHIMVVSPHAVSNPPTVLDDGNDDVSISLESLQSPVNRQSNTGIANSDKDGSSLYLFHSMSHASMGSSSCTAAPLHVSLKLRDKIQRQSAFKTIALVTTATVSAGNHPMTVTRRAETRNCAVPMYIEALY
jgi:hypothetical protein